MSQPHSRNANRQCMYVFIGQLGLDTVTDKYKNRPVSKVLACACISHWNRHAYIFIWEKWQNNLWLGCTPQTGRWKISTNLLLFLEQHQTDESFLSDFRVNVRRQTFTSMRLWERWWFEVGCRFWRKKKKIGKSSLVALLPVVVVVPVPLDTFKLPLRFVWYVKNVFVLDLSGVYTWVFICLMTSILVCLPQFSNLRTIWWK